MSNDDLSRLLRGIEVTPQLTQFAADVVSDV